jgi:hypothetical protein
MEHMYLWARRVRRDILAMERYLASKDPGVVGQIYGDPGDPPPPPLD